MQIIFTSTSYKRTVVKSIITIVLGLILVIWPTEVLNNIVKIIGGVFFVAGLVSFLVSYRERDERAAMGLTSFNGFGSMLLGVLLFFMADFFTSMLMYLLGFLLAVAGVGQLVMLISARRLGMQSLVVYIFPVLLLIAGVVVFVNPFQAKESIITLFGVMSIFYGITDLINRRKINRLQKDEFYQGKGKSLTRPEIEDADYEEVKE